jgi:hypothetical protein
MTILCHNGAKLWQYRVVLESRAIVSAGAKRYLGGIMESRLIELVLRYGRRVRLAWRVLLIDPENVPEQLVKPKPRFSGKSQPTVDHYTRDTVAPEDGVINRSERDVYDAFIASRRNNPIDEGDLTSERVNDFGALLGRRQIFFR